MKLINFILLIFISSIIASCWQDKINPKSPINSFSKTLKEASPDFRKGWNDGCEAGMTAGSNSFYQMFYKSNKQDGFKMATSSEYSDAWIKAWWFCTHSYYVDTKSGIWSSMFAGYQ